MIAQLLMMGNRADVWHVGRQLGYAALLHELNDSDCAGVQRAIARSRTRAELPAVDSIVMRWHALTRRSTAAAELSPLRHELSIRSARALELQTALDAKKTELEMLKHTKQPVIVISPEEDERRALRAKNEQFKAIIDQGNAERDALRVDLAELRGAALAQLERRELEPVVHSQEDDDLEDEAGEIAEPTHRRVMILRFERAARTAIQRIPAHVAAEAMRTLGALAARDAAAWRGVKRAKGIPVLLVRIGIHHRLVLAIEGEDLAALDLVPREGLLTVLKHLPERTKSHAR